MPTYSNKDIELAIGKEFISWYSNAKGVDYTFVRQSGDGEAPDLFYQPNLTLEITRAFNSEGDAKDLGDLQRGRRNRTFRSVYEPDAQLVNSITKRLESKCSHAYGAQCVLVIYADTPLCDEEDVSRLLPEIRVPEHQPFAEIFLLCHVPPGDFRVWQLA